MTFPKIIRKEQIELKYLKPTQRNAQMLFSLVQKNRKHLIPFLQWASEEITKSEQDSLNFLKESAKEWKNNQNFEFAIFESDIFCGWIDIHKIDLKNKICGIGYWLDKEHTGRGIIKNSISIIEDELFNNFNINRIFIRCDKENKNSIRVAQNCDYIFEGELREDVFVAAENRFRTSTLFSKLFREYKKNS